MSGLVHLLIRRLLRRYARATAAAVRPFIVGDRVLDLGAGEGYVGAALGPSFPGWICAADLGHFGRADGAYVVYDGTRLPFAAAAFDTTLLLLTLHHCAEPEQVLDEAIRVTKHRLLVTESVYRTRLDRLWLDLLDGRLNRHRHGGTMSPALYFKRPEEWAGLFRMRDLRVAHQRWLGSRWERLVHHPLLFVLDKSATPVVLRRAGRGPGLPRRSVGFDGWRRRAADRIRSGGCDSRIAEAAPAPAPPRPVTTTLAGSSSTKRIG